MAHPNVKRGRAALWTRERIEQLSTDELRLLHANALRLDEAALASLCDEVLGTRPRGRLVERRPSRKRIQHGLVSRLAALGLRGVTPRNRTWSRGGVRAGDGVVVFVLWAEDGRYLGGHSEHLLWSPNTGGARAWSDSPGGQERLEHCREALGRGMAEGLLAYGVRLEGTPPEEKVLHLDGVDPANLLDLRVEQRGEEFWGVCTAAVRAPRETVG